METLLLKNVIDPTQIIAGKAKLINVLIEDGRITGIGPHIDSSSAHLVYNAGGAMVTGGMIDIHVHVTVPGITQFQGHEMGVDIEQYGFRTGVSTLVDAGTFGADNIQKAIEYASHKITNVLFLMNASRTGIQVGTPELEDTSKIDLEAVEKAYARHPERIIGIKARASKSASGAAGIAAIAKAKALAVALSLPMVVHVGNSPPLIEEVLALLTEGDVVTHCFHGKRANGMLDAEGHVKRAVLAARDRGVLFDIGHGSESFNYAVANEMFANEFLPDIISTDLHVLNANGPVLSLPVTLSKLMTLNQSLWPWLGMVNEAPRRAFGLSPASNFKIGEVADLAIFSLVDCDKTYLDSDKNPIHMTQEVKVQKIIKGATLLPVD